MNNEYIRPLAYVVRIDEEKPIENYDRVKLARTNGWWCVVGKDELFEGDLAVYFEIDSCVPADDARFKFLEKRKYKIKTQKMCGVVSQGLLMPLSTFPELSECSVGENVTDKLRVTYAETEDNVRKASNDTVKKKFVKSRYRKFFSNKFVKYMMKKPWFSEIVISILGKINSKKIKNEVFPLKFRYVHKTDEQRIENRTDLLGYGRPLIVTEKLDGCSATYILEKKGFHKYEFYVCSRNIRLKEDDSIYWEMARKYNIEENLKLIMYFDPVLKYICLQGECVGNVQGNPLKLKENDLYLFNFITSEKGRLSPIEGAALAEDMNMKWVPILDTDYHIPYDMFEAKQYAEGKSVINPDVDREGLVLRDPETGLSFKNVSIKYLLNK